MRLKADHTWELSPHAAAALQVALRDRVVSADFTGSVSHAAGIDVGFEASGTIARAAVAVLRLPDRTLVDTAIARLPVRFPYIPGLLSFREVPVILEALGRLQTIPELLICDAQGYAHPRRFGLACHLGVITEVPTIGVAKSRLIGTHAPVRDVRGAWIPLLHHGETIGAVLRSRTGVQPIYVSIGHRVSLSRAIALTMACVGRFRLPETTRWAHRLASGPAVNIDRLAVNSGGTTKGTAPDPGTRVRLPDRSSAE